MFLAADADGDGIADAGLCHIPGGDANGISYYVGVRIVDNNSAINVNTAWSRQFDYGPAGASLTTPTYVSGGTLTANDIKAGTGLNVVAVGTGEVTDTQGYYRSNVGLLELLDSYNAPSISTAVSPSTEMDSLNRYRWGNGTLASVDPDDGGTITYSTNFNYSNQSDAMENGLARRLDNPDANYFSSTSIGTYSAISLADQAGLASHFCVASSSRSTSLLESLLPLSLRSAGLAAVRTAAPRLTSPQIRLRRITQQP